MTNKLDNEFSPFDGVWKDTGTQKEEVLEQNGKKTTLKIKEEKIDFSKIVLPTKK